jgi:hypothetical protein
LLQVLSRDGRVSLCVAAIAAKGDAHDAGDNQADFAAAFAARLVIWPTTSLGRAPSFTQ